MSSVNVAHPESSLAGKSLYHDSPRLVASYKPTRFYKALLQFNFRGQDRLEWLRGDVNPMI